MVAYFDSSILLSILLGDDHAAQGHELWTQESDRVSSILLEAECHTVLRGTATRKRSANERRVVLEQLATALDEVTLKPVDEDIVSLIRATPKLAECRTLDAVHVATALYFRAAADQALPLRTFDQRMAKVAARVGFLPEGQ